MIFRAKKAPKKYSKAFNLTLPNAWLLLFCQLLNLSTLVLQLSTWMTSVILLCLSWQLLLLKSKTQVNKKITNQYISRTKQLNVSPIILMFIACSGCVVIALSANTQGVLVSMLHLLTFAYALKAFEIKQRKDFYQILLLGLFVLASALIFNQSLAFSLLIFTILIINLMILHRVFAPTKSLFSASKTVFTLVLQSTLLAVVLFIVFPRLSPFWQVPNASSATTGLSDEVSPGDIASLALSSDLAFRVDFKEQGMPSYSQLYWRAMTLEQFDGKKWTRKKENNKATIKQDNDRIPFKPETIGNSITYDVIVEPSFQSWLFGLSVISSSDPKLTLLDDYTVQSKNVISQITQYQLQSYLQSPLDLTISDNEKQRNLAIVKGSNPRLEQLAEQLKKQYLKPIDRAQAILNTFRESNYFYTLQAPKLINNSLDQFYFDTKSGFCVHYASSFTYLMRAAGIPARIVTGYLGGEYNNVNVVEQGASQLNQKGGHLSIYQYDAHAWSEIWLPNTGWKRIDPTAAVDSQRVESGWSNALLTQQFSLNNDLIGLYQFKNIAWLNQLRLQLDAIDYQWTRWVLGYSSKKQYDLLKRWFGKNIPWKIAIVVLITFSFIMAIATLLYRKKLHWFTKNNVTPWLSIYQKLLNVIAAKGLIKQESMSAMAFSSLVAKEHPQISEQFTQFTTTFEQLNYKKLNAATQRILLKKLKKEYKSIVSTLH